MNHSFSQYVRSTAFNLTLSEKAIVDVLNLWHTVLDCRRHHKDPADYAWEAIHFNGSTQYLLRRGLVTQNKAGDYYLTAAGQLVAQLLIEAGFTASTHPDTTMFPTILES